MRGVLKVVYSDTFYDAIKVVLSSVLIQVPV